MHVARSRPRRPLYVRTSGGELNYAQVAAGWGKVYVFGRAFRELARFRTAETSARTAGRGAWGTCGGNFHRSASPFAPTRAAQVVTERTYFSDRRQTSAYRPRNVYFRGGCSLNS